MSRKITEKKSLAARITEFFFTIVFILIITLVLLALMIFDWRAPDNKSTDFAGDSIYLMRISGKIVSAIQTANTGKSQLCTIILTGEELNAITNMALQFYRTQEKAKDLHIAAQWQKGLCRAACTLTVCKGVYLKAQADLIPFFEDQKLKIQLDSCRVGAVPLPRKVLEKFINELIEENLAKDKKAQKILPLLHKAEITPEGGLLLQVPVQQAFRLMGLLF